MTNLERILDCLEELSSNREHQLALWNGEIEGVQASFTEAVCGLFDDAGLTRMLDSGELDRTYSKALCLKARRLGALTHKIDDHRISDEEILNLPQMNSLRETAGELLALFISESNYQAPDAPLSDKSR